MSNEPLITVVGNLTADPEVRQAGQATVTSFTVAATPRVKQGDDWVDGEPTFFRCSAWRELGDNVAQTLQKGARVLVHGRFKTRSFVDKNEVPRTSIEIDVDAIGPELRYATAQVFKVQRNGNQQGHQQQARQQGGPQNQRPPQQPQYQQPPQQGYPPQQPAQYAPAQPPGGPQWAAPYDDETPF